MMKKILRLFCATLVFTMAMGTLTACEIVDEEPKTNEAKYNDACTMVENGDYENAYTAFKELGDYKDSQKYLSRFIYFPTVANYVLSDRSGVMTVEIGVHNMPTRILSEGIEGAENSAYTKDGVYTYDSKGNLMQQAVTYNGTKYTYDYTYDENTNLINAVNSVEGVAVAFHDYVYDENGVLIRESYKEGDVVYYDYEHSYDANGNQIKSVFKATDGDHVYTYTYNEEGKLVNESGSVPSGHWYNIVYTYDTDGNLMQEVYTEDGEFGFTTDYTYDSVGNCIKEESIYSDGAKKIFTCEYDANGNVTKETLTDTNGTTSTVEWQYVLTYLTIDVPASTINQILGIFNIL